MAADKLQEINYFKTEGSDLRKQKIRIDVPTSIIYREKNQTVQQECFYNSIISADEVYDFVGGFFIDGSSMLFEHAWNRSENIMLDTTFRGFSLDKVLNPVPDKRWQCIFIEVVRFSCNELKEIFGMDFDKERIKNKFYKHKDLDQVVKFLKHCENVRRSFIEARLHILDSFKPLLVKWVY